MRKNYSAPELWDEDAPRRTVKEIPAHTRPDKYAQDREQDDKHRNRFVARQAIGTKSRGGYEQMSLDN